MSQKYSVDFVQGEDVTIDFTWTIESTGSPMDLTGATFYSDIRKEYSRDVLASFTFEEVDLSTGLFRAKLSREVTAALPRNPKGAINSFVWDVDVVYSNGDRHTILSGYLKMQSEVTVA